jgi:hypothetical protein
VAVVVVVVVFLSVTINRITLQNGLFQMVVTFAHNRYSEEGAYCPPSDIDKNSNNLRQDCGHISFQGRGQVCLFKLISLLFMISCSSHCNRKVISQLRTHAILVRVWRGQRQ